jgi:hypothetical protein
MSTTHEYRYRHRQISRFGLALSLVSGVLGMGYIAQLPGPLPVWWWVDQPTALALAALFCGLGVLVFGSMTITVERDRLRWSMGWLGFPQWQRPLGQLAGVAATRSSWLEGWGIRYTARGWLYNVEGCDAVRVDDASGRSFRLGTNDTAGLLRALEAAGVKAAPRSQV